MPKKKITLIVILGALTALCPFSIDMYLPAFLQIAADLHVPVAKLSLTLTGFFVGLAAGQLFYGPLLDRFGRKRPLYAALAVYIVASVGCYASRSLDVLVSFRFLQALGGCGANVASMAMVRDFFPGKESAKVFSFLVLILSVSPLFAPTIGGFVAAWLGWKAIFLVLAALCAAMGVASYAWLPTFHVPDEDHSLHPAEVLRGYMEIVKEPQFYTYALASAWALSGLFVYLASSPMIYMEIFHVTPKVYGWVFGMLAIGFVGSSQFNFLLLKRYTNENIVWAGIAGLMVTGLVFFIGASVDGYGLKATSLLLFCFLAFFGVANPNATALALAPFGRNAGSASALIGFLQMGIGALASVGVGFLKTQRILPVAAMFAGSSLLALLTLAVGSRHIRKRIGAAADFSAPPSMVE